jgi:hypothetical protein
MNTSRTSFVVAAMQYPLHYPKGNRDKQYHERKARSDEREKTETT